MVLRVLMGWTGIGLLLAACGGGGGGAAVADPPAEVLPAGWVRLADMPAGRAKFGVAAQGGKLYVTGGYDTLATVFVYDIATNTWASGPALPAGTDNVATLAADGKVYAIGGEAGSVLQVFDTAANSWAAGPRLPSAPGVRFAAAAALLNGKLHVVGGWNASNTSSASLASQDVFDPATQAWQTPAAAPMATARNAAAAGAINGLLYAVGGRSPGIRANDQTPLASTEVYTPGSNSWAAGPPLPAARASLAAAVLGDRLYTFGGEVAGGTVSNAVERLNPATGTWQTLTAMPYRAHGLGAAVSGSAIYVLGGFTGASDAVGSESRALYRYTPAD